MRLFLWSWLTVYPSFVCTESVNIMNLLRCCCKPKDSNENCENTRQVSIYERIFHRQKYSNLSNSENTLNETEQTRLLDHERLHNSDLEANPQISFIQTEVVERSLRKYVNDTTQNDTKLSCKSSNITNLNSTTENFTKVNDERDKVTTLDELQNLTKLTYEPEIVKKHDEPENVTKINYRNKNVKKYDEPDSIKKMNKKQENDTKPDVIKTKTHCKNIEQIQLQSELNLIKTTTDTLDKVKSYNIIDFSKINTGELTSNFWLSGLYYKREKVLNFAYDFNELNSIDSYKNITEFLRDDEYAITEVSASQIADETVENLKCATSKYEMVSSETVKNFIAVPNKKKKNVNQKTPNKLKACNNHTVYPKMEASASRINRTERVIPKLESLIIKENTNVATSAKPKINLQLHEAVGNVATPKGIDPPFQCKSLERIGSEGYLVNRQVKIDMLSWNCIVGGESAKCMVCVEEINKNQLDQHYTNAKHCDKLQRHYIIGVYGLACIRKLNLTHYHCGVCNNLFVNARGHCCLSDHRQRLDMAKLAAEKTLQDKEPLISLKKFGIQNPPQKKSDMNTPKARQENMPARPPKHLVTKAVRVKNIGIIINDSVLISNRSYHTLMGSGNRFCSVCQSIAEGHEGYFHKKEPNHMENLKKYGCLDTYKNNLIRQLPNCKYHCSHCDEVMDAPTSHITSLRHCKRYAEACTKADKILADPGRYTTSDLI